MSSSSDGDDGVSFLAGTLLGPMTATAAPKKVAARARAHAKVPSPSPPSQKAPRTGRSPGPENNTSAPPAGKPPKRRGKGKVSKIPTDVTGLLAHEGSPELGDKVAESLKQLQESIFETSFASPADVQNFNEGCEKGGEGLRAVHQGAPVPINRSIGIYHISYTPIAFNGESSRESHHASSFAHWHYAS
eukprot:6707067-Pyramimonas_sp.AAC.1